MQHWTDYWKNTNALNSFSEGKQGQGYQKDIADFWENQFKQITPSGTVVDLGTGNGAVAVLAWLFSKNNQLDWNVIGIDAANIDPRKLNLEDKLIKRSLNNIEFIANTPIETAPFQAGSIDAFISQFAFEYSDLKKSLQHCFNCLKPGGIISIISHHPKSHISYDSLIGEKVIRYILEESPAFMQTDLLLDIALQQTQAGQMHNWTKNPHKQVINTTLHWIFAQLTDKYSADADAEYWCKLTIGQIVNILKQVGTIDPLQLKRHLQQLYHNLVSHRLRLQDQNNACLSETRLEQIEEHCKTNGISLKVEEFYIEGKLFAFHLIMQK
ncbi:class I SAM-dependent methyltransferase [Kangiella koreensis]|uniref:Methyltransferase type 11 n=1 Tax=Kangiella koreensis (strain DSM 16069 / JCM 12317 / KCTC 12182 / SW-125) TaxID=523791 RepID=C7R8C9_KANKD|nr:class I SAM-dependent methyltransferase [Kangiella koreensis]ACV27694.1 Methyltransferase type 11 [Kangiella koreensis DSM 16069]